MDSDDEELDLILEEIFAEDGLIRQNQPVSIFMNKNGQPRLRNRSNESYHKRPKVEKPPNPWLFCNWLKLLQHPETEIPDSVKGKEFERSFRMSVIEFQKLVKRCRDTGEAEFT